MSEEGDDLQATAILGAVIHELKFRSGGRAVVVDLDPQRTGSVIDGHFECAAVSRSGVLHRVRAQLRGEQDRLIEQGAVSDHAADERPCSGDLIRPAREPAPDGLRH